MRQQAFLSGLCLVLALFCAVKAAAVESSSIVSRSGKSSWVELGVGVKARDSELLAEVELSEFQEDALHSCATYVTQFWKLLSCLFDVSLSMNT